MEEKGLKKGLSAKALLAIGLGAVVGWSWIIYAGLWSTLGGTLGGIIAFAITGILCSLIGLVYAELTSMYPKVGGDVVFVLEGIGTKSSIVTMWTLLVFWIGLIMIETMMFPVILTRLGVPLPQWGALYTVAGETVYISYILVSLLFNIIFAFMNTRNVEVSGNIQTFAVYFLLAAAVFLFGCGVVFGNPENMKPLFTSSTGFMTVFLMLPGFMAGFNAIPQAAEEANVPPKRIGQMVIGTVWAAVIFYGIIVLGTALLAPESVRLGKGLVVLDAIELVFNGSVVARSFITFASLLGMLTTWNACYIAASRLVVGLAKSKYLPYTLSEIDTINKAPVKAIKMLCIFSSIIVFFGANQAIYVGIIDVFSFGLVISWILVCISFLRLSKNRPDISRPYKVKHPKLIGWAATIFSFLFLLLYMPFGSAGLKLGEWIAVAVIVVIALIVYLVWNNGKGKISREERLKLLGLEE